MDNLLFFTNNSENNNNNNEPKRVKLEDETTEEVVEEKVNRNYVYLSNMPHKTPRKCIEEVFALYGKIDKITTKYGNEPPKEVYRDEALVYFIDESSADKAMEAEGKDIAGRNVKVQREYTRPKRKAPLGSVAFFVGNLPYEATKKGVMKMFKDCGKVLSVRLGPAISGNEPETEEEQNQMRRKKTASSGSDGNHGGFGWIIFEENSYQTKEIFKLNGAFYGNRKIKVQQANLGDNTSRAAQKKHEMTLNKKRKLAEEKEEKANEEIAEPVAEITRSRIAGIQNSRLREIKPVEERVYNQEIERPETSARKNKKVKKVVYYKPVCMMFQNNGECSRGDACMFSHDT